MINFKMLEKAASFKGSDISWNIEGEITNVVYIIRFSESDFYVGSTTDLRNRFKNYVGHFKNNTYPSASLQYAFNRYGSFDVYIVERCFTEKHLTDREQFYIEMLNPTLNKRNAYRSVPKRKVTLRIKELLKEKKMTVVNLAERVGITQPNMSNIVNGKSSPSLETLEKIALALEIPITEIFDINRETPTVSFRCPCCGAEYDITFNKKDKELPEG